MGFLAALAPFAPAIGSALGSVIGGHSAESAAKDQQKWSERMSNTAHQREVKDLLAAGLNPMLSFKGSGAPMPASPDVAQARTRGMEAMGGLLGQVVTTALQNENIRARTDLARVQEQQVGSSIKLTEAQISKVQEEYSNLKLQGKQIIEGIHKTYWEGLSMKQQVELREKLNPLITQAQELSNRLAAAGVPSAEADARMWERLDEYGKEGKFGVDVLKVLRSLFK